MISTPDRRQIITLINEAVTTDARLLKAFDVLNMSMRTIQLWRLSDGTVREDARPSAWRPTPINKLSDDERVRILHTINQPEFALNVEGVGPLSVIQRSARANRCNYYAVNVMDRLRLAENGTVRLWIVH